jgi:hypothetical protein
MESRFWNKLEFTAPKILADLWQARKEIKASTLGIFAAIVNEFSNGTITRRPWGADIHDGYLLLVLMNSLENASYLRIRSYKSGVDDTLIDRAFAYLILLALRFWPAGDVAKLVTKSIYRGRTDVPEVVHEIVLTPMVRQLLSEMQDICSADCKRVVATRQGALTSNKTELDDYWLRFTPEGKPDEPIAKKFLHVEATSVPCKVGFRLGKKTTCPLFRTRPTIDNIGELFAVIKRVAAFREAAFQEAQAAKEKASS